MQASASAGEQDLPLIRQVGREKKKKQTQDKGKAVTCQAGTEGRQRYNSIPELQRSGRSARRSGRFTLEKRGGCVGIGACVNGSGCQELY
jgi:hypothetical protein